MQQQQNNGVAPGSAGPSVNPANGQNHVQMHQNTVNPVVPGRPLSANAAAGPQWSNAHTGNTGHLPNTALPADTMQKQTNCASMPNLVNVPSVTQSVDLLADIMGETNTRLNGEPVQNSNCNNANGGSGTFVGMMSDALSSSMPCGLNTADGGGGQAPGAPPHSGGFSAGGGCPPAGAMQRHMSVPGAPTLLESGRPTSLPNVNEPPREYSCGCRNADACHCVAHFVIVAERRARSLNETVLVHCSLHFEMFTKFVHAVCVVFQRRLLRTTCWCSWSTRSRRSRSSWACTATCLRHSRRRCRTWRSRRSPPCRSLRATSTTTRRPRSTTAW